MYALEESILGFAEKIMELERAPAARYGEERLNRLFHLIKESFLNVHTFDRDIYRSVLHCAHYTSFSN